jgi:hypothetical protein
VMWHAYIACQVILEYMKEGSGHITKSNTEIK